MTSNALKHEIYHEINVFLKAYQSKDDALLKARFDIDGDFLDEIYEMLDFIDD